MEYLYLNSLKRVGSYFSVSYQYALLELTADKLRIVDGYFDLYSNTALSIAFFESLVSIGQYLRLYENDNLRSVRMTALTTLGYSTTYCGYNSYVQFCVYSSPVSNTNVTVTSLDLEQYSYYSTPGLTSNSQGTCIYYLGGDAGACTPGKPSGLPTPPVQFSSRSTRTTSLKSNHSPIRQHK